MTEDVDFCRWNAFESVNIICVCTENLCVGFFSLVSDIIFLFETGERNSLRKRCHAHSYTHVQSYDEAWRRLG